LSFFYPNAPDAQTAIWPKLLAITL